MRRDAERRPKERRSGGDAEIEEALCLAELRLAVEGAMTASEEQLARLHSGRAAPPSPPA